MKTLEEDPGEKKKIVNTNTKDSLEISANFSMCSLPQLRISAEYGWCRKMSFFFFNFR